MWVTAFFISAALLPLVAGRGRGGGGGSGGSSSGGGTSTIEYTTEECYTNFLGAVFQPGNDTDGIKPGCKKLSGDHCLWVWNDGHKNETRNYLTYYDEKIPTPSWEMEVTDAYYNGTYSLTLTPPPSNATYDCPELKSPEISNMYLRVGPQKKNNVSREDYGDKNSYYFQFGRSIFERDCPQTPNKAFVNFESSNDNLENAQIWTLNVKKDGDKFELDGTLTSKLGSYNNFYNYVVNTTGTDKDYSSSSVQCPRRFYIRSLDATTAAKFNATVTATSADMTFSFTDTKTQWQVSGTFSGKHWEQGPKLLFNQDSIATEGQTEHIKPRAPKDKRLWIDKYLKYILIGVGIILLIGIIYFLWVCAGALFACLKCCFPCCSSSWRDRRQNKKNMAAYQTTLAQSPGERPPAHGTPQMTYANKTEATEVVTSVQPHDPRDEECMYAVSPTVMQSYYVQGGKYLVEIANAQMELHAAHRDLQNASASGDQDKVSFSSAMVQHHSAVIEHFMALRASGM